MVFRHLGGGVSGEGGGGEEMGSSADSTEGGRLAVKVC